MAGQNRLGMRLLFSATLPKLGSEQHLNDDARDARPYRGVYAMSDGATESYNSRIWARILVTKFVARPLIDEPWIEAATSEYAGHFDWDSMSWSAQAAFDRGSFATLIGLQIASAGSKARVTAVGDSLAVLVVDGKMQSSFPYTDPSDFRRAPTLLATLPERNKGLFGPNSSAISTIDWDLPKSGATRILLMTDAIGAWLLTSPTDRIETLLHLPSRTSFSALVSRERSAGRMRNDDTTLFVIG